MELERKVQREEASATNINSTFARSQGRTGSTMRPGELGGVLRDERMMSAKNGRNE